MRVIVLSSGGIDSSMMMQLLKKEDCRVFPLFIDYGQLAANAEWEACQKICKYLDLKPSRMEISGFGRLISSGLTNHNLDIEKDTFLPTRNLLLLSVGAAYGYYKSAYVVAIGLLSNPIFPDQTAEFVQGAQGAISKALGIDINILTPLIFLNKCDILLLARKYGLPVSTTYSCYSGTKEPCGHCSSCKERIAAEKVLARMSR